jgi:tRNA(adenine34) deaminase
MIAAPWLACLEEAWAAYRAGSLPIGAAYADASGVVLLRGRNRIDEPRQGPELSGSRIAHAEMNVLAQVPPASHEDMAAGVLYTSLEPCPMCFGAALMCGVREIRYGARDGWAGAANLTRATPYLASKAMQVVGPEPMVQTVSLVLQTDAWLRRASPRSRSWAVRCSSTSSCTTSRTRSQARPGRPQRSASGE